MEFKQFIIENWEYIATGLGLGGAGLGGQKAWKVLQKQKDKGQDSRIRKNASDIITLKSDMGKLNNKVNSLQGAIEVNGQADIEFRSKWEGVQTHLQQTLEVFMQKYFDDRDDDKSKTIEKLEKRIDKLTK